MNILINCSNLKIGGGLQVAHSFISKIKEFDAHSFTVITSTILSKQSDYSDFPGNVEFVLYNSPANALKAITGKNRFLDEIVKNKKIEVVFSVFGPSYWKPNVKHIVGFAKPHYVYMDSPFFKTISNVHSIKISLTKFFHMLDFKRNNQVIVTENEDVTTRLKTVLKNKKIHTVTNYYNQVFDNEKLWDKSLILPKFDGFSMLTISANYPHKNLQIIPKVICYLNENYKDFNFRFVLTVNNEELFKSCDENILKRILTIGVVNINQCPGLYSQSDAIFLPTLLECFTATYPEAMRMRKPILTSNLNFATGLCEDAAQYFDPLNPQDIGDKIYELATNKELRNNLVLKGIDQLKKYDTYDKRAEKYLEIIKCNTIL